MKACLWISRRQYLSAQTVLNQRFKNLQSFREQPSLRTSVFDETLEKRAGTNAGRQRLNSQNLTAVQRGRAALDSKDLHIANRFKRWVMPVAGVVAVRESDAAPSVFSQIQPLMHVAQKGTVA